MAPRQRDDHGLLRSAYDERGLYDVVREVVDALGLADPLSATQADFDAGRAAGGHADAPSARAICMRLGGNACSMPWREVLVASRHEAGRLDRAHGRRRGRAEQPELSDRHLFFALRFIASRLGVDVLTPDRYTAERERAIAEDRRRGGHARLDHNLPTVGQIERIVRARRAAAATTATQIQRTRDRDQDHVVGCTAVADDDDHHRDRTADDERTDETLPPPPPPPTTTTTTTTTNIATATELPRFGDSGDGDEDQDQDQDATGISLGTWNEALELVGLRPWRSTPQRMAPRPPGLPYLDAVDHYVEHNGHWPTQTRLAEFARRLGIRLARQPRGRRTADIFDEVRRRRAERGLGSPGYTPRSRRPLPSLVVPAEGIPGAPQRSDGAGGPQTTEDQCVEDLVRFLRHHRGRHTRRNYIAHARAHELTWPRHFDRYGGFGALRDKARQRLSAPAGSSMPAAS